MLSIIVPVYNVENYLNCSINSILKQSYSDFELILVDDGSTDKSGKICDEYASNDQRIQVYHRENRGASAARNFGIIKSTGEYVSFLDSDDYWCDTFYLEKIVKRLESKKSDVLCVNFHKVADKLPQTSYFSSKSMPIGLSNGESIDYIHDNNLWIACAWNKIIRRDVLLDNNLYFIEGVTAEDIEWSARLALAVETFDYLDVDGIAYIQREGSVSKSMNTDKVRYLKDNVFKVEHYAKEASGKKKVLLDSFLSYQLGTLLLNIALMDNGYDKSQLKGEIRHLMGYLKYSSDSKIKVINYIYHILGYNLTLSLLKLSGKR